MIREATKECSRCGESKPLSEFIRAAQRNVCKPCWAAYTREWRRLKKRGLTGHRIGRPKLTEKVCKVCGELKRRDEYYIDRRGAIRPACKRCESQNAMRWHRENRDRSRRLNQEYKRRVYERDPEAMRRKWRLYSLRRKLRPAVDAYRSAKLHYGASEGREATPFAGIIADQIIDGMTKDWRERIRLMCQVLDMAKDQG